MRSESAKFCQKIAMTPLFAVTAALSACLLFLVQPLIAKPILPLLGGSPSVWISCMVTFQLLLLAGYIYAYASSRLLSLRQQVLAHLLLFGASLPLLPFGLHAAGFDAAAHPQTWLVATLLLSVGAPYLLLSSSAPMLQRWAANTSHPIARNPYPLYAASNAGSFLGLLIYPLLIEPRLNTPQQFTLLTVGYLALALGFGGCAALMLRHARAPEAPLPAPAPTAMPVTTPTSANMAAQWRWLCYSALPASLLFGTTTYIITDIASVPLLWIIPLMLYIASFILAFADQRWQARNLLVPCALLLLLTLFSVLLAPLPSHLGITPPITVVIVLATLFVGALLFHRRLYELRPAAENSGLFYVILALGGAIGGCFNSFVAPLVFRTAAEFPLVLVLSLLVLLLPEFLSTTVARAKPMPVRIAVLAALLLIGTYFYLATGVDLFEGWYTLSSGALLMLLLFCILLLCDWLYRSPFRVLSALALAILLGAYVVGSHGVTYIYAERNFFGISRVRDDTAMARRSYVHGVTLHGVQSTEAASRLAPGSYYTTLRDVFANLPDAVSDAPIAVIGLGVGTVACYAKPQQAMDFYEIDPASIHIATTPAFFTFMRDCPGQRKIIVGDGRLNLAAAPDARYGFIIMDAFTSDAIPMHLLTLEALRLYGRKLQPQGLVAFNISNRYLNLLPVFRTLAAELGWTARYKYDLPDPNSLAVGSLWVVLAKTEPDMAALAQLPAWKTLPPAAGELYRWTDDYTNLLGILRFTSEWKSRL